MAKQARVNMDGDLESRDEFWRLLPLVGGDRDVALGKLVRWFRLAQNWFVDGVMVPRAEIEAAGLECMIQSGWAVSWPDTPHAYQALEAEDRFAWIDQKHKAASPGGKARAAGPRDARGRLLPKPAGTQPDAGPVPAGTQPDAGPVPAGTQPDASRTPAAASALVLAPVPVPVPAPVLKKERETESADALSLCKQAWIESLRALKSQRDPVQVLPDEEGLILRTLVAYGPETVYAALIGAQDEPGFEGFDPRQNIDIERIIGKDRQGKPRIRKHAERGMARLKRREQARQDQARGKAAPEPAPGSQEDMALAAAVREELRQQWGRPASAAPAELPDAIPVPEDPEPDPGDPAAVAATIEAELEARRQELLSQARQIQEEAS